ncbi:U11/U12 small nuclear ribonucleoprotein 48 kDa protein isoform X1 [Lasioglossum baleicum]|uniref:U11/U12 small nuclear ribonucleoprotein 48 kDa protein isoform X1 n=1 Tax=Lasioglossum baleicum TaxID=434251 RepID=UPI003FCCCC23
MLTCTLNHRGVQHQNLSDFTKKIHQEIMDVRSVLDWTVESIEIENDNRLICPYDSSHRVGKEILDQHLEHCQWKEDGYHEFDLPLSEPNSQLRSPFSIKLDADLQNRVIEEARTKDPTISVGLGDRLIPRTSDRIFTDFTRDERKALYEYVVSRTIKVDAGHDFTNTDTSVYQDKDNKELSFLELLVQERNLKRRRAKHRGVHTNKKSHMEILREIIDQQMEIYTDHVAQQHRINSDTKAVDIVKTETPTKHLGDTVQNASSSSPIDSPYDGRNFVRRDSQHYHGVSNFRNDRTEASHANTFKDRHKRDKHSRSTTESRKTQRHRKHKRSRSRERDYSKKSRSEFTEKAYARGVTKYDETGRFNDAGY